MGGAPKRHGRAYPRDYTGSPKETFQLALIKPLNYAFPILSSITLFHPIFFPIFLKVVKSCKVD